MVKLGCKVKCPECGGKLIEIMREYVYLEIESVDFDENGECIASLATHINDEDPAIDTSFDSFVECKGCGTHYDVIHRDMKPMRHKRKNSYLDFLSSGEII